MLKILDLLILTSQITISILHILIYLSASRSVLVKLNSSSFKLDEKYFNQFTTSISFDKETIEKDIV